MSLKSKLRGMVATEETVNMRKILNSTTIRVMEPVEEVRKVINSTSNSWMRKSSITIQAETVPTWEGSSEISNTLRMPEPTTERRTLRENSKLVLTMVMRLAEVMVDRLACQQQRDLVTQASLLRANTKESGMSMSSKRVESHIPSSRSPTTLHQGMSMYPDSTRGEASQIRVPLRQ